MRMLKRNGHDKIPHDNYENQENYTIHAENLKNNAIIEI